jgi:hypothetical protein
MKSATCARLTVTSLTFLHVSSHVGPSEHEQSNPRWTLRGHSCSDVAASPKPTCSPSYHRSVDKPPRDQSLWTWPPTRCRAWLCQFCVLFRFFLLLVFRPFWSLMYHWCCSVFNKNWTKKPLIFSYECPHLAQWLSSALETFV